MHIINNGIEDLIFDKFMQLDVDFYVVDTTGKHVSLKQGKIINFNIKPPFLHFRLVVKDKVRDYYLPSPFAHYNTEKGYCLSYALNELCEDENIIDKMIKLGKVSDSKLFNNHLYIKPKHD